MDYIQEELLRQKRALEALMTGSARQMEESAEDAEPEHLREMRGTEAVLRDRTAAAQAATDGERRSLRGGMAGAAESGRGRSDGAAQEIMAGGAVREVRFISRSQTAQADVQAISRTIQRDARRYDGGFSLY